MVDLSPADFIRLSDFIYSTCGIRIPPSKKAMLCGRLQKRLAFLGIPSFAEYCAYLFSPQGREEEARHAIDMITTNKTDFFREPAHFDYLTKTALPDLMRRPDTGPGKIFRIWSAGCSTGEEPYTLAMVLSEFAERCPSFRFSILATDISTRVLESARLAVYPEERAAGIPLGLKRKYFLRGRDRSRGLVRIVPELRKTVAFHRLNFMDDEFRLDEQIDVIFCRNVMIYFDRPTQERLVNKFIGHLPPGGFLFLGHAETLNGLEVRLLSAGPTIYRMPL